MEVALKAVDGDAALLTEIARIFLLESPKLMEELEGGMVQGDAPQFRRAAHTIKSGMRMFGAEAAYLLACRLEELGPMTRDLEAAGEPFTQLKQALAELDSELAKFVADPAVI